MPNNNPQSTSTPQQPIAREIARASDAVNRTGERLEANVENAASVAIEKVRQVRDQAQSGLEQQRVEVVERIRRVGDALRSSSETLARTDPLAHQLFDTAHERIERVAGYVETLTPGDLASDVAELSRRRPGIFFGGAFILGLALGRFAKSSTGTAGGEQAGRDHAQGSRARRASAPRTGSSSGGRPAAHSSQSSQSNQSNQSNQSSQSNALPQGVSSSTPATTSGRAAGSSSGSPYGASPGHGGKQEASGTPSNTAREVPPGEGSKS